MFLAVLSSKSCAIGVEIDLARSGAGARWEAFCEGLRLFDFRRIKDRSEQLIELISGVAQHGRLPVDELFLVHVHGELERGRGRALTVTRLEHEQLAFLDCELDVLHILEVLLQLFTHSHELCERLGHFLLQTRHRLGSAHACHDVFALRVHEKLAVELVLAVRRVASESHARTRRRAGVAINHRLHIHRRTPRCGDVVLAAIHHCAIVHPRAKHSADGSLELFVNA